MRAPEPGGPATLERPSTDRAAAREAAPVPQGGARLDAAREFESSAPAWLERIVRLRGEGRDAEADAELKRFRERYPEAQVSPAALPRGSGSGTR
jgi:hypothetical protein